MNLFLMSNILYKMIWLNNNNKLFQLIIIIIQMMIFIIIGIKLWKITKVFKMKKTECLILFLNKIIIL